MSSLFCGVTQAEPVKYIERYLNHIKMLADELDTDRVCRLLRLIQEARGSNKTLFIAGNGGSASTASHMVNDLCIGTRLSSNKIRAVSLVDNISIITAVANDFSYEDIFSKQLEYLASPGDILLLISASGNSKNLLEAASYAKLNDIYVFSVLGFDGGALLASSDDYVLIKTLPSEYGPVEDIHLILNHIVSSFIRYAV